MDRRLAVAYATWVSPAFYLQVIDVFLAYKDGELVHSSTPTVLRQRFDFLVEAKAKGLISDWDSKALTLEAIRSNWNALPNLSDDAISIFQMILRSKIRITGPSFTEPKYMTIYEALTTAENHDYGSDECFSALNNHGIDLHHSEIAISPENVRLCNLLRLSSNDIRDSLMNEPHFKPSKRNIKAGRHIFRKPMLVPFEAI